MIHDYSATDYSTTYYDKTFNMNFLNGKKIITDILLKLKPIEERVIREFYFNNKDLWTLEKELFSHFKTRDVTRIRKIVSNAERSLRSKLANLKDNYI